MGKLDVSDAVLESESSSYPLNVIVQGNMQNSVFQAPSPSREKGNPKLRNTIIIQAKEKSKKPVDIAEEVCKKLVRYFGKQKSKISNHQREHVHKYTVHTFLKREEDSRPNAIIACEELAKRRKQ